MGRGLNQGTEYSVLSVMAPAGQWGTLQQQKLATSYCGWETVRRKNAEKIDCKPIISSVKASNDPRVKVTALKPLRYHWYTSGATNTAPTRPTVATPTRANCSTLLLSTNQFVIGSDGFLIDVPAADANTPKLAIWKPAMTKRLPTIIEWTFSVTPATAVPE